MEVICWMICDLRVSRRKTCTCAWFVALASGCACFFVVLKSIWAFTGHIPGKCLGDIQNWGIEG